jgi:hypothetical protein
LILKKRDILGNQPAYNKFRQSDRELHPLERTPQPNEESRDAEIQSTQEDLAVYP